MLIYDRRCRRPDFAESIYDALDDVRRWWWILIWAAIAGTYGSLKLKDFLQLQGNLVRFGL